MQPTERCSHPTPCESTHSRYRNAGNCPFFGTGVQQHRQRSRQASRLPQSPERPNEVRVDDPLFDGRGDSDCKVEDPENRLENRDTQERPRVQGANEPQANLCGSEQDADEHEGYADNPSSVGGT
jgi:hypothetical protein